MQLPGSSETCSGSEHVGQKWLEEYIIHYNQAQPPRAQIKLPKHGSAVVPMLITTLYMQGQADVAEKIKKIAEAIDIKYTAEELSLPPAVLRDCLVLGVGYRCPRYLAHVMDNQPLPRNVKAERLTVLEEVEFLTIRQVIQAAMIDGGVATEQEFRDKMISGAYAEPMRSIRLSAAGHLRRTIESCSDEGWFDHRSSVADNVLRSLDEVLGRE